MGPDLDLHPDTVRRLSGSARHAAEILGAPAPEPPPSLGPDETEAVRRLARSVRRAADELAAFATVAEICAGRAVGADRLAAAAIRSAGDGTGSRAGAPAPSGGGGGIGQQRGGPAWPVRGDRDAG